MLKGRLCSSYWHQASLVSMLPPGPVPGYMQSARSNHLMINNLNIAGC
ncbi:hypothetical protein C4K37_4601 [Pseudomonas chlororaphis subsp. piscium]|nr:hypothetical protein C4K37_4601 [Pseudomonas chlororaphis subsp. piscium]AZC45524.1 hypothetical protein C4K36_4613 [Pseudomonas chlororaphis subsp. piscium]